MKRIILSTLTALMLATNAFSVTEGEINHTRLFMFNKDAEAMKNFNKNDLVENSGVSGTIISNLVKHDENFKVGKAKEICSLVGFTTLAGADAWTLFKLNIGAGGFDLYAAESCLDKIVFEEEKLSNLYLNNPTLLTENSYFSYLSNRFSKEFVVKKCANYQNMNFNTLQIKNLLTANVSQSCKNAYESGIFGYSDKTFTTRDAIILNILVNFSTNIYKIDSTSKAFNSVFFDFFTLKKELNEKLQKQEKAYENWLTKTSNEKMINKHYALFLKRKADSDSTVYIFFHRFVSSLIYKITSKDEKEFIENISPLTKKIFIAYLSGDYQQAKQHLDEFQNQELDLNKSYEKMNKDERMLYLVKAFFKEI